jgi:hypothetical protein
MSRAVITDKGLSKRLGQEVVLFKGDSSRRCVTGTLVFYPDCFAVQGDREEPYPIEKGEEIQLRMGKGKRNVSGSTMVTYVYSP